ncbi:MAG TPA: carboxypeptidase-like regulatory domain-containing protein [Terriglobales bacterium]|nr:carboxypeptidase-like regulatory domain-containing protein [Terriglobales bacterium]
MTKLAQSALLATMFSLALASAAAQTLTGTVTNGTTSKPAVGDEVIIINLANGMDVAGSTKVDSNGKFSFKLTVPGPHLIRAVHQGVTYHQMAPPGVNTADVQVYDVATKVAALSVTADVIRFQADSSTMQGIRLFVVSNTSSPPKTQMNDHNFEFYLPAGAKIEQLQARAPNGQPISADAVPDPEKTSEKNRYAIAFPLRPGETQFQVEFTLPYSGEIKIDPKPLYSAQHLVIVLPKTMQFKAANPSSFQSMQDPTQGDSNVEVAQQTEPGQPLGFTLKGTGVITESPGETASGAAQQQEPQGRDNRSSDNRPGGGLGAPIDAPDALQKYRWPILFGFAVLLAIGGWVVTKRQTGATVAAPSPAKPSPVSSGNSAAVRLTTTPATSATSPPVAKSSMLLEALKEELFQLEVERKQGKITPADYEKAKAALDQTLERALKRQG